MVKLCLNHIDFLGKLCQCFKNERKKIMKIGKDELNISQKVIKKN